MQPPTPWAQYLATVVTVDLPEQRVTVTPTDDDPTGELPPGVAEPVHVLTAWNPRSERLDDATNRARNHALRAELDRRHATWFPARGASPDGSWHEDSFAVTGWTRHDACALARAHDQTAVFELRTGMLAVVHADDPEHARGRACDIAVDTTGGPSWGP